MGDIEEDPARRGPPAGHHLFEDRDIQVFGVGPHGKGIGHRLQVQHLRRIDARGAVPRQEFLAEGVGEARPQAPHVAVDDELQRGVENRRADLEEFHVDEARPGPVGHRPGVPLEGGGVDVVPEDPARAAAGQDDGPGADEEPLPPAQRINAAYPPVAVPDQVDDAGLFENPDAQFEDFALENPDDLAAGGTAAGQGAGLGAPGEFALDEAVICPVEFDAQGDQFFDAGAGLVRHHPGQHRIAQARPGFHDVPVKDVGAVAILHGVEGGVDPQALRRDEVRAAARSEPSRDGQEHVQIRMAPLGFIGGAASRGAAPDNQQIAIKDVHSINSLRLSLCCHSGESRNPEISMYYKNSGHRFSPV